MPMKHCRLPWFFIGLVCYVAPHAELFKRSQIKYNDTVHTLWLSDIPFAELM